jgi:hypothetical protein
MVWQSKARTWANSPKYFATGTGGYAFWIMI